MTYWLATEGFVGDDYGPFTRGWIELDRGGRVPVQPVVAPPAFVRVLGVETRDPIASITARPSRVAASPLPSPSPPAPAPTVTVAPFALSSAVLVTTVVEDGDD